MKLLISNQYGAIVMALLPFVYGMLLASPVWAHFFLLLAWFSMYLLSYPMLSLFKGKNMAEYKSGQSSMVSSAFSFALPAIFITGNSFLYCRHVSFCVGEYLLHQEKR